MKLNQCSKVNFFFEIQHKDWENLQKHFFSSFLKPKIVHLHLTL